MRKLGSAIKRVIVAVDWGFTNPGVLLTCALDGDGRLFVVHQVYRTGKLIDWWVEQAKRLQAFYHEEAHICDPSEPAYIEAFRRAGLRAVEARNEIAPGIQAVQERLRVAADGKPRLIVLRGSLVERDEALKELGKPLCVEDEITAYVWPKGIDGKPNKEVPVDADNHALDALRYAVMYCEAPSIARVRRK